MSKAITIKKEFNAAACAEAVTKFHRAAKNAAGQAVLYAVLAGKEIAEAKESLPHGEFLPWLEKHTPVSHTTAMRYRDLYDGLKSKLLKFPTVGNLLALPAGAMTEEQAETFDKVVHKATDGATLTELYRDYGLAKKPVGNPNLGGNHGGDYHSARHEEPSLEEQLKLARKTAVEDLGFACARLEDGSWMVLDDPQIEAVLHTLELAAKAQRKWIGTPRNQRAAHREEILRSMQPKA